MFREPSDILALDFDGVVCDGLLEYFASTKQAYRRLWCQEIEDSFASSFYLLRPVIETGWEMPVLLRALVLGRSQAEILNNFQAIAQEIIEQEKLSKQAIVQSLDRVRDEWIKDNLSEWLALHRFYPGVIQQLKQIVRAAKVNLYIVTTKEGRFVKQLLQQQGVDLPSAQIIGKESKRPKYETLRMLQDRHKQPASEIKITFVEDRLPALQQVAQQPDLELVKLFLAAWGYNKDSDRLFASQDRRIKLLSLENFQADFSSW